MNVDKVVYTDPVERCDHGCILICVEDWISFKENKDPTPPVPNHPSTYLQTILAFFISRLESFLTKTAANLSVQSDKTNPPVLHHVTLLNQSKPHNHSNVESQIL